MDRVAPRIAKVAVFAAASVLSTGCFASIKQLDQVRDDVSQTRAEAAASDSARAMQVVQILSTLRELSDSVNSLSQRLTRVRAETQADVRGMKATVSQIQESAGQSEARMREMSKQLDSRLRQVPPSTAPAVPNDSVKLPVQPSAPTDSGPDAEELYRIGRDQLTRGANGAARSALTDLLTRYPQSELAADAQYLIAEAYAADKTNAAADSAYAAVVSRYPDSPRAPTALYKRGVLAQSARRTTAAKRIYNELIDKYPASDEAELARERLRVMG